MRPLATATPWQRVLAQREFTAQGTGVLEAPMVSAPKLEVENVRKDGLVFEIGITYTVMHYQTIGIAFMRGTFQSFRPLLILFIFGQILKSVFFLLDLDVRGCLWLGAVHHLLHLHLVLLQQPFLRTHPSNCHTAAQTAEREGVAGSPHAHVSERGPSRIFLSRFGIERVSC